MQEIRGTDIMKIAHLAVAAAALVAAMPASVAAMPGSAKIFTLNQNGGNGSAFALTPTSVFTLTGTNDGNPGVITTFSAVAVANGTVAGGWLYRSYDIADSSFDPAGYFVDGNFTQLSIDGIPGAQPGGSFSFTVAAGQTFGFYVFGTDGCCGAGELFVYDLAVPEPGTWAMLIAGFGLVGAVARRRKALAAA